jgi:hypothetical protein
MPSNKEGWKMNKSIAVLDKPEVQPLTLTITLSHEDAEFLKEHTFWTGESPETCIKQIFAEYRQPDGTGEDLWWDIARDPKRRAAAFKRNKLSEKESVSLNESLDATFARLQKESDDENVKRLKKMGAERARQFLRNASPETAKRLLLASGHDPNCLRRRRPKKSSNLIAFPVG